MNGEMMTRRKRQYLWTDQEFYNLIMSESQRLKKDGFKTGSADLTKRLVPILKENVDFKFLFPQVKWKKKGLK